MGVLGQMTTPGVQRETGGLWEGRGGNKSGSPLGAHSVSQGFSLGDNKLSALTLKKCPGIDGYLQG